MGQAEFITGQSHLLQGASAAEPVGTVTGCTVTLADGRTLEADEDLVGVLNLLLGDGLAHRRAQVVVDSEWMSPESAAKSLSVSRPTVYKWMDTGVLSFAQVGTHRRVPREDVDALIRARLSRESTDEVLADHSLDSPLSEEDYRRASFDARRSGGSEAVAQLARAQHAAKARAAAVRARLPRK